MRLNFTFLGLFLIAIAFGQVPQGYYSSADGLSGNDLKAALHNIIKNHDEQSYDALKTILKKSDEDPDNPANVILIYTGRSQDKDQFGSGGNDWNREHVWAKSHGDFGNDPPAGTDAHHIRPADASVNSSRSNKDFDEGGTQHSEATECYSTSDTWEPRDAVKGDVARMMLYMSVRYEGDNGEPDLELVDYIPTSGPNFGKLSTLLKWHEQDPVDDFERNRNEVVYSYQNNRNPFIDHPEYVCLIWGDCETNQVQTPYFTPSTGQYFSTTNVEINCSTEGAAIYYTTNGNTPTTSSTEYTTAITINETTTIKAIAVKSGLDNSNIAEGTFEITNQLLFEDFETSTEDEEININGWSVYAEIGTENWEGRTYDNNKYASMSSYQSADASNKSWLISPEIDLSNMAAATLNFESKDGYNNGDPVKLFASTNYTGTENPTVATWTELTATFSSGSTYSYASSFTESGDISLDSYTGNSIHIAFVYTGSVSGVTTSLQIDNVQITGDEGSGEYASPAFTAVSHTPSYPLSTDNVSVYALVENKHNISAIQLNWGTSRNDLSATNNMTWSSDRFNYNTGSHTDGTTIYYAVNITASDNSEIISDTLSFTIDDSDETHPPSFNTISFDPELPLENDQVTVTAIIDNVEQAQEVNLKWGIYEGILNNTNNMAGNNNSFSYTFSSFDVGTTVYFSAEIVSLNHGTIKSDTLQFTIQEIIPESYPQITNIGHVPTAPTNNDNISVNADISDTETTIAKAELIWWTQSSATDNVVTMTHTGNTYTANIAEQTANTQLNYCIKATNDNDYVSISDTTTIIIETATGTENISLFDGISVYPNPASNYVVIEQTSDSPITVSLFELNGNRMVEQNFTEKRNFYYLNNIEPGIYLLRIRSHVATTYKRIIIQR